MKTLEQIRAEDAARSSMTYETPVRLIGIDLPFSAIFKLTLQIAAVQIVIGLIVGLLLIALDVI